MTMMSPMACDAACESVFRICQSGSGRFSETRFDCGSQPRGFQLFVVYETRSKNQSVFMSSTKRYFTS